MNKVIFKKAVIVSLLLMVVFMPVAVLAEETESNYFTEIIDRFVDKVVWPIFLGLVAIMFIYAGGLFLTAGGDPSKISQAKKAVIWGVIGIVVGFLAFSAYGLIQGLITSSQSSSQQQSN